MSVFGLRVRELVGERMDDPDLDPDEHAQALEALARLNAVSGVGRALFAPLLRLALADRDRPLTVVDAACGGGDLGPRLLRRARRRGLALRLLGLDASPREVDRAATRARALGLEGLCEHRVQDLLAEPLPAGVDAVLSSLFLHHLDRDSARRFLVRCREAAPRLLVVHDLDRTRTGYALAWAVSRLGTRSAVVREDALLSVRAAWKPAEVLELAREAGLAGVRVRRLWPERWQLEWWNA